MNNRLPSYFFVLKGLNVNNPVRSAGKMTDQDNNPEGVEYMIKLKFNPFGALVINADTHIK